MTWRDPAGERQASVLDCDRLYELANTYHPFVRWSDAERFYPALVESWLQHASTAPWPDAGESPVETGTDLHRRGTALCRANPDVTRVDVTAGAPNPDDTPLSLDDRLLADDDTFLDFGGWAPQGAEGFQGREGDLDYLFRAFSELAGAINPALQDQWSPVELMAHLPQFWTPQPPTPTVYCEARMAEDFAQISDAMEHPDFPPGAAGVVGDVIVLTYHYFFPAREASPGEPAVRAKEGQWEAVSIFFRGQRERDKAVVFEPPIGVAISQGTDGPSMRPKRVDFRPWQDVHHEDTHAHPILFCSQGTHRWFFAPTDPGETWVGGTGGPVTTGTGSFDNNDESTGWESILVAGLIIAAILAALGLWLAALIVLVIAFLLWLLTKILDACSDDAEDPANPVPSNPEAQGNGAQSGDPFEPPAPGSGGGDGSPGGGTPGGAGGVGGYGIPNSGSPSGADTSSFDLRLIDRLFGHDDRAGRPPTGYPSHERCEDPGWWDFTGRWGIRVTPGFSGSWSSGDQRVDGDGRSWGYWHTLTFFEQRHAGMV